MVISVRNLYKKKRHTHSHFHIDKGVHTHDHDHHLEHTHIHDSNAVNTTPWILFLIFVFGPCEPLIPIVMYPAAENNISGAVIVSLLFSAVTISTMMLIVLAFKMGLSRINLKPIEKYSNLIAGAMIFFSGIAIQFLGL
jgi:hypothetical protein